jgi:hypothetical protein
VYDVRYFFADTAFTVYEYVPVLTGPDSTGPLLSISIFDIVYLLPFVLCVMCMYHTSIGFYFRLYLDKHTCSSPKMCMYFAYTYICIYAHVLFSILFL